MKIPELFKDGELKEIAEKVEAGERLNYDDGVKMAETRDLATLGYLANSVREVQHEKRVYYSNYLNLNPTNVCDVQCLFCSFARLSKQDGGYTMSMEQVREKVERAVAVSGIREVHVVGGLNDNVPVSYYYDIVSTIKDVNKDLFVKAWTAVEIDYFAERDRVSYGEVLMELKRRGLDALPGGGAEIFNEAIHRKICVKKMSGERWLEVHRVAHSLGIRTNCSMLYGHIESPHHRVEHILKLRDLQDETGGFNSFIPLAYQDDNNPLSKLVTDPETDGITDLKVYAISRLLFDNIPHIKGYWTTIGLRFAQVALSFGVDDLGGTAFDEKIMHDAGADSPVDVDRAELVRIIKAAGYQPCEVVSSYDKIFSTN